MSNLTLYREIDALGGGPSNSSDYAKAHSEGYTLALTMVLEILAKRGFTEESSPSTAVVNALKPILDDLGRAGPDGWTNGYVHTTDLDRLQQAVAELSA